MLSTRMVATCSKISGSQNMSLLAGAFLLAVLPFELEHLILMLIGGGAYYALSTFQPRTVKAPKKKALAHAWPTTNASNCMPPKKQQMPKDQHQRPTATKCKAKAAAHANEMEPPKKTLSVAPVAAPIFGSIGWEEEVTELLAKLSSTHRCEKTVQCIASTIKHALKPMFPEAEVSSYFCGNIDGGKAFGVAVPEVDIVISLSPTVVTQVMLSRDSKPGHAKTKAAGFDARALQKYAIRLCTERLVASSGLKFRRSAFRGDEPKVTFLAPATLCFNESSVPLDVSVNSLVPLHNAALLTECGQLEPRAKALILLVRRWAKDRGICHASKGHFQPYVWTLLTIYFLQVGVQDEEPLLPPVENFELSSNLVTGSEASKKPKTEVQRTKEGSTLSASDLFKAFFRFYSDFDWQGEAVAVWSGKRAVPAGSLPRHVIVDGNKSEVGPSIEDPFTSGHNLGTCLTNLSLARLKEELNRANRLCTNDASLSVLLEPWAPEDNDA
jgi:hypothetical protein